MNLQGALLIVPLCLVFVVPLAGQQPTPTSASYQPASHGTRWLESDRGLAINILVEATNLGGTEVEVGEITFPVGSGSGVDAGHFHNSVEIFYILEGEFAHIVNGESHRLSPGMVGIVRPGDSVVHRVLSDEPVRAVVIWAPGGEVERLAQFFRQRSVEQR